MYRKAGLKMALLFIVIVALFIIFILWQKGAL
jgi:hypothetical protein